MKKKKLFLLVSSVLTLSPILAGLILWDELPEQMTTHWGMQGNADGFMPRALAVFALPLLILAIHFLCVWLTLRDHQNKEQNPKVLGMVLWISPLMSIYLNTIVYLWALGMDFDMSRGMFAVLGVIFLVFGNYLPKCKQNGTVGVRIPWVYTSEENWNRTHRLTGRVWFIMGFCYLVFVFLPTVLIPYLLIATLIPMAVVPVLYSYCFYRKQVANGEIPKKIPVRMGTVSKITTILLVVILVATIIFCEWMATAGKFEAVFEEDALIIDAVIWRDMEITYADIEYAELRESDTVGDRVNGYGGKDILMGAFENEEFGSYTRYSHAKTKSCVVLCVNGEMLVLNDVDDQATRTLYETILEKISK